MVIGSFGAWGAGQGEARGLTGLLPGAWPKPEIRVPFWSGRLALSRSGPGRAGTQVPWAEGSKWGRCPTRRPTGS